MPHQFLERGGKGGGNQQAGNQTVHGLRACRGFPGNRALGMREHPKCRMPVILSGILAGRGGGDLGAQGFFIRLDVLLSQDFFLCAFGTAALLTPDLFRPLLLGADPSGLDALDAVQKQAPGQKTVQGLRALLLTFNGKSCRDMNEIDAGCGFVDLLAAGTGGADKGLAQVAFGDAKMVHACLQGGFFFRGNIEQAHG